MRWLIQCNIFLKSKYGSLRVHKSTWKKQNLTQFELAEKAELSVDSIKRIEHGSRTMSLENFMRIADALAVPLSYLLYESLNEIPISERILNVLNSKNASQQEYLVHMLEEMSFGLDRIS